MRIDFTFRRDPAYLRTLMLPDRAAYAGPLRLAAAFGVVSGLLLGVALAGEPRAMAVAGGLVLAGVALSVQQRRLLRSPGGFSAGFLAPRRWLLTDDCLESRTEETLHRYDWSAFRRADATDVAYLLVGARGGIIDVPRRPLGGESDAELAAFLRDRGLLAAAARPR